MEFFLRRGFSAAPLNQKKLRGFSPWGIARSSLGYFENGN
jgi:hypothetical protein